MTKKKPTLKLIDPGLPDVDETPLTLREISDELHGHLTATGFHKTKRLLDLKLNAFVRENGEDFPARLLSMAREARKYGRSLACILYDLDGRGKTFTPHCHRYAMAGKETDNV